MFRGVIERRSRSEVAELKKESAIMKNRVKSIELSEGLQSDIERYSKKVEWTLTDAKIFANSITMLAKAIKMNTGVEPSMEELDNEYIHEEVGDNYPYSSDTVFQIAYGILDGVNMIEYAPGFSSLMMREIRLGFRDGLDASIYANEDFYSHRQMEQVRLGLMDGIDVSMYNDPEIRYPDMEVIRKLLVLGYNETVKEITSIDNWRNHLTDDIDDGKYWWCSMLYNHIIMNKLPDADVAEYMIHPECTIDDLKGIAHGLHYHRNVDPYLYNIPHLGSIGMEIIQKIAESSIGTNIDNYNTLMEIMGDVRNSLGDFEEVEDDEE